MDRDEIRRLLTEAVDAQRQAIEAFRENHARRLEDTWAYPKGMRKPGAEELVDSSGQPILANLYTSLAQTLATLVALDT